MSQSSICRPTAIASCRRVTCFALAAPLLASALAWSGCASRNYTYYIVEPEQKEQPVLTEEDSMQRPFVFGSNTVMKVRWNDGDIMTEVDVPMLSSGQRVVVEHSQTNVKTLPASAIVAPPPSPGDKSLVEAYRQRGLRVDESAPDISIIKARTQVQDAVRTGNYALALEWIELVLGRYPSHPEFLRAKASVLLMMGEKPKAIETYEQAEAIESDPAVRKKLEELQKSQ